MNKLYIFLSSLTQLVGQEIVKVTVGKKQLMASNELKISIPCKLVDSFLRIYLNQTCNIFPQSYILEIFVTLALIPTKVNSLIYINDKMYI